MILCILTFWCSISWTQEASISADYLRCEYLVNPPAIHQTAPRLSWIVEGSERGSLQTAYQILVASSMDSLQVGIGDLWDSGEVPSNQTNQVTYKGMALTSRQQCFWKVRLLDEQGRQSGWSDVATWHMGLLDERDWKAHWIGFDHRALNKNEDLHLPPSPYLRKEITVKEGISRATLYSTSLGVYEARINGAKVGEDYLAPGWTDYHKRVYYQTHDVTHMIQEGKNCMGMILANGWYAGYLGYSVLVRHPKHYAFYGEVPVCRVQMVVEYDDGSTEIFGSDADWRANTGPIVEADILMGETYDATAEFGDWDKVGFDDSAWKASRRMVGAMGAVESSPGVPVRVVEQLAPIEVKQVEAGKYIFDFGTNFAGVVRLQVKGDRGRKLQIRYGEMLHPDGRLMTENLRRARATDTYILSGASAGETWTPRFTYHGFQYVEVSGLDQAPSLDMLTGLVLSSATPRAGTITTGDKMVNQLYSNVVRTQLANYFDVPTDCPQRDERMGWTGDAQIYIRTASFNHDIAAFHQKWLVDLNDGQLGNGAYPNFAPFPFNRPNTVFSPAWMDAGIICPYVIYKVYGDHDILQKFYPAMKELLHLYQLKSVEDLLPEEAFDEVQPAGGYGDWLNQGAIPTSKIYLANAYWLYDLKLMTEIAAAIGEEEESIYFATMHRRVQRAFVKKYVRPEGALQEATQTACALALSMDLVPTRLRAAIGQQLVDLIHANDGYLETGFLGTKYLLESLSDMQYDQVALQLFTNKGFPSWLYEVVNGATSIWERWDSYTIERGFGGAQNTGMNSFSHYAFGAVAEWMFRYQAGIDMLAPGYRKIKICPSPNLELGPVRASYHSICGEIISGWEVKGADLTMDVTIPANTTAEIWIPATAIADVTEGAQALAAAQGITDVDKVGDKIRLRVGSGAYHFMSRGARKLLTKL